MRLNTLRASFVAVAMATIVVAIAPSAHAIIVMGSQGNNDISSTPAPDSLDSLEGTLGGFMATPIDSRYLLTANHIGSGTTTFSYLNAGEGTTTNYTVQYYKQVGNSDLAIWEIVPSDTTDYFPVVATLEQNQPAFDAPLVVLGRGTDRGSPVTGGWAWGADNHNTSWGTNNVTELAEDANSNLYLAYAFTRTVNGQNVVTDPNEAILSNDDSGGGLFIQNPTTHVWELAGINYGVDDFATTMGGANANDALYDSTGYYGPSDSDPNNDTAESGAPEYSYDSAIYSNYSAITALVSVPEPTTGLLLMGLLFPILNTRRFRPAN